MSKSKRVGARVPSDRQKLIEHVITLIRLPQPKIRPVIEFRATDGRWHRPYALPTGVQLTEEQRNCGFAFINAVGKHYGFIEPSRAILMERHETAQRFVAANFRAMLENLSDDELLAQADYWLSKFASHA